MKKTIMALILFAGAALAQTASYDSLRGSHRVVTNETDTAALAAIAALPAQTNQLYVAAAGAVTGAQSNTIAAALQPSWAVTGTVQNAQRLVAPDGSLVWMEIIGGTNWQYCVTNAVGVEGNRDKIIVTGWIVYEPTEYAGPPSNTVYVGTGITNELGILYFSNSRGHLWWNRETTPKITVVDTPTASLYNAVQTNMPATTIGGVGGLGDTFVTIDWYGPITNRYQIATQIGTVIMLTEHDEDPEAHADIRDALAAIPTTFVGGTTYPDLGSNIVATIIISNQLVSLWKVIP